MSIQELSSKIKARERELFLVLLIMMIGFLGYGLGRLSTIRDERIPVRVEQGSATPRQPGQEEAAPTLSQGGLLIGSKNAAKYHLPWCPGAKKISEKNKVWFASEEEAEQAGYSPAANCPGL